MYKLKKLLTPTLSIAILAATSMTGFAASNDLPSNLAQKESTLLAKNPTMSRQALDTSLRAYGHLREQGKDTQQILTFINYDKPDEQKRMWVINMKDTKVVYNPHVAQGKNTGLVNATHFSNSPGSLETSIGVFLTGQTYMGEHGNSLRLIGLDKGFNNNAYQRDVVMHSAWYVSQSFVSKHHYLGHSWGCLALSKKVEPLVVNEIKDGTVIVSYYPNKQWLASSPYVQPLTA